MSQFAEVMRSNPPRLVVEYTKVNGEDQFRWGIVGTIPVLTLIGHLSLARDFIIADECQPCDQSAFVITHSDGIVDYYVNSDIPTVSLMGMLEVIKAMLVDSRLAQMAAANVSPIVGPNGQQIKRI